MSYQDQNPRRKDQPTPNPDTNPFLNLRLSRGEFIYTILAGAAAYAGTTCAQRLGLFDEPVTNLPPLYTHNVWRERTFTDAYLALNANVQDPILDRGIKVIDYSLLPADKRSADSHFFLGLGNTRISAAVRNLYEEDGRLSATGIQTYIFRDHATEPQYNLRVAQKNPELAVAFCYGVDSPTGMAWTECSDQVKFEFLHDVATNVFKLPSSMKYNLSLEEVLASFSGRRATIGQLTGQDILPDGRDIRLTFDQLGVGTLAIKEPFHTPNTNTRFGNDIEHRFSASDSHLLFPVSRFPWYTGLNRSRQ